MFAVVFTLLHMYAVHVWAWPHTAVATPYLSGVSWQRNYFLQLFYLFIYLFINPHHRSENKNI